MMAPVGPFPPTRVGEHVIDQIGGTGVASGASQMPCVSVMEHHLLEGNESLDSTVFNRSLQSCR
jgi:hypothetical protein